MHTIKYTLIRAFLLVILACFLAATVIFIQTTYTIFSYKKVLNVLVLDSRLISDTSDIIVAYNQLFKDSNSMTARQQYDNLKKDINSLFVELDKAHKRENTSTYVGLKNIIESIITETELGLGKDKISNTSVHYDEANKKYQFVKDLAAEHFLLESNSIPGQVAAADSQAIRGYFISSILALLSVIGAIWYIFTFAKRLTNPIIELTSNVKQITAGNLDITLQPALSNVKNEIGILASSFGIMLQNLKTNISKLNETNKQLEASSSEMKAKNEELLKLNNVMVNRELRMIELKKELEALKSKVPPT